MKNIINFLAGKLILKKKDLLTLSPIKMLCEEGVFDVDLLFMFLDMYF